MFVEAGLVEEQSIAERAVAELFVALDKIDEEQNWVDFENKRVPMVDNWFEAQEHFAVVDCKALDIEVGRQVELAEKVPKVKNQC